MANDASAPANPILLTPTEVGTILSIVSEYDPIIVGGQCIAMWVDYLSQFDEEIAQLGSVSSADVDYYENPQAAKCLAERLQGDILLPDDAINLSPNACTVSAFLNGKQIHIDFMREVVGVDQKDIAGRYVTIVGRFPNIEHDVGLALMHPLDCVRSRLANVETLERTDAWSLFQLEASFKVLRAFIEQLLFIGEIDDAARSVLEVEYILRDWFYRPKVYPHVADLIRPRIILAKYLEDDRLDSRWREFLLARMLQRIARYEQVVKVRLSLDP